MKGKIKKIHTGKTFCFIAAEDGVEYFLHRDSYQGFWDDLLEDTSKGIEIFVEFTPMPSGRGPRASEAKRIDFPN